MRVLLDTDVVLDILPKRDPWQAEITALRASKAATNMIFSVTGLTVANAYYICRKQSGSSNALKSVRYLLDAFEILPMEFATLDAAASLPGNDFEDNIQIAAAVASGVNCIVTRDQTGFLHSPLPVHSAEGLLSSLGGELESM